MNTKALSLIAIVSGLWAGQTVAAAPTAEELVGSTNVGAFVDYFKADDVGYEGDGTGYGALVGYRFTPEWAARIRYEVLDLSGNVDGENYGFDAQYYATATTFVNLGLRHLNEVSNQGAVNLGMGNHFFIGRNFALTPEFNMLVGKYHDFSVGLGLNYFFGVKDNSPVIAVAEAAAPADTDQDGVLDTDDQCPDTPAGASVDANGCELDSDNDGVVDSKDQCPATPAGAAVDANGCELDSDNDGVVDSKDQCPNTPAGDKVDEQGCSVMQEELVTVDLHVAFANNSAVVPDSDYAKIEELATYMARYAGSVVTIEGHTSKAGSAAYNKQLSQKRADAVAEVLISDFGIARDRVTAIGYGEERPLDDSGTQAAAQKNRRVTAKFEHKHASAAKR